MSGRDRERVGRAGRALLTLLSAVSRVCWSFPRGLWLLYVGTESARFRGRPVVWGGRSIHDAEEPRIVPPGVPAGHRRTGLASGRTSVRRASSCAGLFLLRPPRLDGFLGRRRLLHPMRCAQV